LSEIIDAVGPRNIYISLLVAVGIVFPGALLFRDEETASQVVVVVAFTASIGILQILDARQRRREGRE
jgi:hypothetical protein